MAQNSDAGTYKINKVPRSLGRVSKLLASCQRKRYNTSLQTNFFPSMKEEFLCVSKIQKKNVTKIVRTLWLLVVVIIIALQVNNIDNI